MGINFPASPTVGQLYPSPAVAGVPVWKWDGSAWVSTSGVGLGGIYISDTVPAGAPVGALWWESDTGSLFLNYNDGDSSQWVAASMPANAAINGRLLSTTYTTSTMDFYPTNPLTTMILAELWGAGGGGGATSITSATQVSAAGAGGGGAYGMKLIKFKPNATVTITAGATALINWPAHGITVTDTPVKFSGTLPPELTAGTSYYVRPISNADSFSISATKGGAAISIASAPATYAIVRGFIMATGAGGLAGQSGGTTIFDAAQATGGNAGGGGFAATGFTDIYPASGGYTLSCDFGLNGYSGTRGWATAAVTGGLGEGAIGGTAPRGGSGGNAGGNGAAGNPGSYPGGGGGAAWAGNSKSSSIAGGQGANGGIIVWEYA